MDRRTNILYLAPWVDLGGADKGTIDWFRWLDRDRFRASLVTTQPSPNRRLAEVVPYAEEVWALPELMRGVDFPHFIADFIESRRVDLVHVMNSQLGFDLLPDLGSLPHPPAIVVQLHVEEEDRSGYVRHVTTRYGNLVDAFSVTSLHLAEAMRDYDVLPSAVHVIPTGIDARREFAPGVVGARPGLEDGAVHVLFLGRLVEQKDPLLMVESAARLRETTDREFRVHVVGDGGLEGEVRERVARLGLEGIVLVHPPTTDPREWYAACDLLLMTSAFEGVPYVLYEAMAMKLPVVVPALPGNTELMEGCGGVLIPSRDPAEYADALGGLIENSGRREQLGEEGRARMLAGFSLAAMASAHADLYEALLARRRPARARRPPVAAETRAPEPVRFRSRAPGERPLVSIVIPCYNDGRYLPEALESVAQQTYPAIETVVVDDASTDPESRELLGKIADRPGVKVIRLDENSGPSAARNAALELVRGRYVLPLDADNRLLPDAVERLVEQLACAGETIGFIYPNQQFFGNRADLWEAPAYNLATLLEGNYCDTCSLIDRQVFDAGVRYPEDIVLGHEDWDFALTLAEREIRGQPASGTTVLVRKHGFTRADRVEHAPEAFGTGLPERHPSLFGRPAPEWSGDVDLGPLLAVRARWAPAISLVFITPIEGRPDEVRRLVTLLRAQTCRDAEAIVRCARDIDVTLRAPAVRRLPAALGEADLGEALAHAVECTRGRLILVTELAPADALRDPAAIEKLLRLFRGQPELSAAALAETGQGNGFPLRLLDHAEAEEAVPHTLVWRAGVESRVPYALTSRGPAPVHSLTREMAPAVHVEWRHLTGGGAAGQGEGHPFALRFPTPRQGLEARERRMRLALEPVLPGLPPAGIRRWAGGGAWVPIETTILCRHRRVYGEARLVTTDRTPPPGYTLEFELGSIQRFPKPGTRPLVMDGEEGPRLGRGEEGLREAVAGSAPHEAGPGARVSLLGHLEQTPFPLFAALQVAWDPVGRQQVLVSGSEDPLAHRVERAQTLGFVVSYPIEPRHPPRRSYGLGLAGLFRAVDLDRRRHAYAVGSPPTGELVGELGGLVTVERPGLVALRRNRHGYLVTDAHAPDPHRPGVRTGARHVLAPLAWRGPWPAGRRRRAAARRLVETGRAVYRPRPAAGRDATEPVTLGFLLPEADDNRVPLYSALHTVNGDQLLTTSSLEASDMGYGGAVLLGYLRATNVTGSGLGLRNVGVPWASRFGLGARRG